MDELDSPKSPPSLESSSGSQKRVSFTPPTPSPTKIIRSFGSNSSLKGVNLFLNSLGLGQVSLLPRKDVTCYSCELTPLYVLYD